MKKKVRPPKAQAFIDRFRGFLVDNELFDLGYTGHDFTKSNFWSISELVEERLNKLCAST